MKPRSPLLAICLALALAGSGLTGWLHPAAAAQTGFEICSANGTRTADQGTGTGSTQTAHDCVYCGSAPVSGTADHVAAAGSMAGTGNTSVHRPAPRVAHRDRLNAEPRAPPAVL